MNIHIIIPDGLSPLEGCLFAAGELKRRAKRQGYPLDAPQHADSPHRYVVRLLALCSGSIPSAGSRLFRFTRSRITMTCGMRFLMCCIRWVGFKTRYATERTLRRESRSWEGLCKRKSMKR